MLLEMSSFCPVCIKEATLMPVLTLNSAVQSIIRKSYSTFWTCLLKTFTILYNNVDLL